MVDPVWFTAEMRRITRRWLLILLYLGLWEFLSRSGMLPSLLFPAPGTVLRAGVESLKSGELWWHWVASIGRVIVGFGSGASLGVAAGTLVGLSDLGRRTLGAVLELFRPVPALAWIPMILMWFGIGETGKVILIAYSVFFAVYTAAARALRGMDPRIVWAARTLGASAWAEVLKVRLPAAMPEIWTGVQVGAGTGFSVLVAAELVAATRGLGWWISDARRFFRTDVVLLGMITIGLTGWAWVAALRALGDRLFGWRVG
jgi:sulfonate transport system permease protein